MTPLIILAPARSYSTVASLMLGQHPQMYGLPETHLLMTDTIRDWWMLFGANLYGHGLLRVVAELVMGVQSNAAIFLARGWLLKRLNQPSSNVFCELVERVFPRMPVDKSPLMVTDIDSLMRARAAFPDARFLHLTRHPRSHGRSVMNLLEQIVVTWGLSGPLAATFLYESPSSPFSGMIDETSDARVLDPQILWYQQHCNILSFLEKVPRSHQMRVRGEELIADRCRILPQIVEWVGLRSDPDAIEEMSHPERSAYACYGPSNARFGGDPNFFQEPTLRASARGSETLDGSLPWRPDGNGFAPHVCALAVRFGYQ